jgi:hypothetical protein
VPEVQYEAQGDKQILLIDLVGISDFRLVPSIIEKAIHLAQSSEGPGSVRTLIDLSDTPINREIRSSLKNLSRNNGQYAKATAFVGLTKSWSILLSLLFLVRGKRNHKVLSSRTEALLWLEQR